MNAANDDLTAKCCGDLVTSPQFVSNFGFFRHLRVILTEPSVQILPHGHRKFCVAAALLNVCRTAGNDASDGQRKGWRRQIAKAKFHPVKSSDKTPVELFLHFLHGIEAIIPSTRISCAKLGEFTAVKPTNGRFISCGRYRGLSSYSGRRDP